MVLLFSAASGISTSCEELVVDLFLGADCSLELHCHYYSHDYIVLSNILKNLYKTGLGSWLGLDVLSLVPSEVELLLQNFQSCSCTLFGVASQSSTGKELTSFYLSCFTMCIILYYFTFPLILVFRAGCGNRLCLFLIIAFSLTFQI